MPHCKVIAYCLMPNHFHLMLHCSGGTLISGATDIFKMHPISHAIKTILSSYSQAINLQEVRTGSLFQQNTKAKYLQTDDDYPLTVLHHIHQNPIRAGLAADMTKWEFSSFREYIKRPANSICATDFARQLLTLPSGQAFIDASLKHIEPKRIWPKRQPWQNTT